MKVTPSALVGEMSGSAGGLTAAKWKGIQYFRTKVTPNNPNTAAQQTQRAHMARLVSWWNTAETQLKDAVNALAAGKPYSGFNHFASRNVRDMADDVTPRVMPLDTEVEPIGVLSPSPGADQVDLAWTAGDATSADSVYIIGGPIAESGALPDELQLFEKDTTTVGDGTTTITGLTGGVMYLFLLLVETEAGGEFSIAKSTEATPT